jgi:hypothetical protein
MTFCGLKNAGKSQVTLIGQSHQKTLKRHKMVLSSSRDIVSLKLKKNSPGPQFVTADRMSL